MESSEFEVAANGVLSLSVRKGGNIPWWWYLDIKGQPLYQIGNSCGTCQAIFDRVRNANMPMTPCQLSEQLEAGLGTIGQDVLETVSALLPRGKYRAELLTVTPSLVTGQDCPQEISCGADYFWLCNLTTSQKTAEYEIILPIVDRLKLGRERIDFYKSEFQKGGHPTALSFSMYDERAIRGEYLQNAFVHFLLDGHHKVMAASEMSHEISMLSFLALDPYTAARS